MASACPPTPTKAAVMGRSSSSWKCGWGTVPWGGWWGGVGRVEWLLEESFRTKMTQETTSIKTNEVKNSSVNTNKFG